MNLVPTLHLVLMEYLIGNPRQVGSGDRGQGKVNEFHHVAWEGSGRATTPRQKLSVSRKPQVPRDCKAPRMA